METTHANVTGPVEFLSASECWRLLSSATLGRLAVSVQNQPEIFPVNFVAADGRILIHTAPGTKLVELLINDNVAFEADAVAVDEAWSVVAKGAARILDAVAEVDVADQLAVRSLMPSLKYIYIEIIPREITGRRFNPGQCHEPSIVDFFL